ncbi:MAG: hypothetical protein ACI87W_000036 [Halieaceae bacterium]|jgi:hypothetical protein
MAISPHFIPLTHSLRDTVVSLFAEQAPRSAQTLQRSEILEYLARSKDTDGSPLSTIKRRAARKNRTPHLAAEDYAALVWVCEAFSYWEESFPLEEPLRGHIHRLLPLAVAVAISEPLFFLPGGHALHQMLDALQSGAVGWQQRLDRAGQMLEQRVERAVEKALEWFKDEQLDIDLITREFVAANERDSARAQRMVQRLLETETARIKTLAARRGAATHINDGLKEFQLPAAIGDFLKGAWYDSAQLVLVKFGASSQEWLQMQRATRHLMESVQHADSDTNDHRDRQEQLLRHIPGELRNWLLSLEHDSDATDGAIGLVEYAHLRLQYGQQLQLIRIGLIPVDEDSSTHEPGSGESFSNGHWYDFEDEDGALRAQLALQLENSSHLLFTNFVGLKALDLPSRAFRQRLNDGFAAPLPDRHTFSISLAAAAGMDSDDALQQWLDPDYRPLAAKGEPADERVIETQPTPEPEPQLGPEPQAEPEQAPWQAPLSSLNTPENRVPPGESPAADSGASTSADSLRPYEEAPAAESEMPEQDSVLQGRERLAESEAAVWDELLPEQPETTAPVIPAAPLTEEILELTLDIEEELPPAPPPPQRPVAAPPEAMPAATAALLSQTPVSPVQERVSPQPAAAPPVAPQPTAAPPFAPQEPPLAKPEIREVEVPMGAWLGFHDGETPMMAKLAVFDPRRDNYIFVNRKGIALRELSRGELLALMDRGLVDILETHSYFRDEVERVRGEDR